MKTATKSAFSRLPTTFDGLIRLHAPRPIRDKADYENMVEVIDALAGHKLNRDQDDYLLVLSGLVERYEADTLPERPRLTGVDMLNYILEENALGGDDFAKIVGVDRSVAYRILKGERNLTTNHIRRLADRFSVRADLFI
jgi:HTH-type transcriptional regulator / antitoxin HigA